MKSFVLFICTALAAAYAGPIGPHQRVINDDIDEILGSINEAVQLLGYNYIPYPNQIDLSDSSFQEIKVGELSSWKRLGNATVTGDGLQNFSVSADFGLGALQFNVGKLVVGDYSGPLSVAVLDNSAHIDFHVENRFQTSCKVTIDKMEVTSFADPRYFTPDFLASGFTIEKSYILGFFRQAFFDDLMVKAQQDVLQFFLCRDKTYSTVQLIKKHFKPSTVRAPKA